MRLIMMYLKQGRVLRLCHALIEAEARFSCAFPHTPLALQVFLLGIFGLFGIDSRGQQLSFQTPLSRL